MKTFHIDVDAVDEAGHYTDDEIVDAMSIANGIVKFICVNGWKEGFRNNIAVDLTIACHIIGQDSEDVVRELWYENRITKDDKHDAEDRIEVIKEYLEKWDPYADDYMMMASMWSMCDDQFDGPNIFVAMK